jgi:hypothetical protein
MHGRPCIRLGFIVILAKSSDMLCNIPDKHGPVSAIALYARLIAKGKVHNAALVACARKLLIYANTVVQRGTPWIQNTA